MVIKETCEYCSWFQFGWCNYHDKDRKPDSELCKEIKEMKV